MLSRDLSLSLRLFFPPFLAVYSITVLVLEVIGRFLITMAINVAQQYPVEVLPTVTRAQGSAAIHTMGYVSVFLSPSIIYLVRIVLCSLIFSVLKR